MKFNTILAFFCLFFSTYLGSQSLIAPYATNQVLVKFKTSVNLQKANHIRQEILGLKSKQLGHTKIEHWNLPPTIIADNILFNNIEEVITHYSNHPDIEFIEPNYSISLNLNSNDPRFTQLWGLNNEGQTGGLADADIDAPEAWDIIKESPNIKIGVIDTGIDWTHPDLVDNIWQNMGEDIDNDGQVIQWNGTTWEFDPDDINGIDDDGNGYADDFVGWDFVNDDNNPYDDNAHGTHVAGTIGAEGNNAEGVIGVTWDVQLAALKFLDSLGSGYTSDAIIAIDYAREMGFHLTNNSWGGSGFSSALYNAISQANDSGQLFVAAAGNSREDTDVIPHYPSAYDLPNIIAVAATNHQDNLAFFSSYGATTVDLAAPGQSIYSCIPGNAYASYNGTSMATPHVSGAIALIWENCNALSHLDVKERLLSNVDLIPAMAAKGVSEGRLNILNALQVDEGSAIFTYNVNGLTVDFAPDYAAGNTYYWQFGDGNTSSDTAPVHTYAAAGSYMVCLTIENDCASYYYTSIVQLSISCDASFDIESSSTASDGAICQGYTGTFTNTTAGTSSSVWKINNEVVSTAHSFDYVFDILGTQVLSLYTTTSTGDCSISQEIFVHQNAQNLYLGEDVYTCETSFTIDSELPGMAAYLWNLNGSPITVADGGGMPTFHATESGTYILGIIDHCDQFMLDTIEVSLDDCDIDYVWPGDTDKSGKVDIIDALKLIIHSYKSGPPRPNNSSDWTPQIAPDWDGIDIYGVNDKHIDCNGDGFTNINDDGIVIIQNYGLRVPTNPTSTNIPNLSQDYFLFAEQTGIAINGGTRTLIFELQLQNTTNQALNIAGIAFSADYHRGENPELDDTDSELGDETDDNIFTFSKRLPNDRIDAAIGRTDGMNFNVAPQSNALIAKFIIDENIVLGGPTDPTANFVALSFNDIVLVDNQGSPIYLGGSSASYHIDDQSVGTNLNLVDPLAVAMVANHALNCPTGSIVTALPRGGIPPYDFLWENGQTTNSAGPLYPGVHKVTITDAATEQIEGRIFVEGTISCANVLPIQWLGFQATAQTSDIALEWTTAYETDVEKFEIQRSLDGLNFNTIATSPSKRTDNHVNKYQWLDKTADFNTVYYYRIKTVEADKLYLSEIESAYLTQHIANDILVQPNPTQDKATLFLTEHSTRPLQVSIYNQLGQQVFQFIYPVDGDRKQIELDLSTYDSGVYFVKMLQHQQTYTSKIIKQ